MSNPVAVSGASLEGPDGKLGRANQHLADLREEVARRRSIYPHTITVEDDPNTSEYVFKVTGLQPTDPRWSYAIGDCVHNLRSALDHLVYQLATLALGQPLTETEARTCQFPVFSDPNEFKDRGGEANIRLLRAGEKTRITELQPFNAWDASIWGNTQFVNFRMHEAPPPRMLQRLKALDNTDKHRLVHATWYAASWVAEPPPIPYDAATKFHGRLEDGAEIGRWRCTPPRPQLPADMDMNRYFPIGVSLGEPFMFDAMELLGWCADTVEWVIGLFRPCFADGSVALPVTTL
jgi:hypothetical protein